MASYQCFVRNNKLLLCVFACFLMFTWLITKNVKRHSVANASLSHIEALKSAYALTEDNAVQKVDNALLPASEQQKKLIEMQNTLQEIRMHNTLRHRRANDKSP